MWGVCADACASGSNVYSAYVDTYNDFFARNTRTVLCQYCDAGSAPVINGLGCIACQAGTYSLGGQVTCTACPQGTYNPSSGQGSVSSCAQCPAGTFNNVNGVKEISKCLSCGLGTYSGTGSGSCLPCSAGFWSDKIGVAQAVFCEPCPSGTASSTSRATSSSACVACSPGFYSSAEGSAVCSACPAGRYCAGSGLTNYGVACSPGMYSQYSAAISNATCVVCPPGSYCPNNGTISPIPCAPDGGSFSAASGAKNSSQCRDVACPAGYFCPPGAGSPTACPAGYFSSNIGASSIAECRECSSTDHRGYYCPGTNSIIIASACQVILQQEEPRAPKNAQLEITATDPTWHCLEQHVLKALSLLLWAPTHRRRVQRVLPAATVPATAP